VEVKEVFIDFIPLDMKTLEIFTAEITNWHEIDRMLKAGGVSLTTNK
jgi:hypothetical protein